MIRPNYTNIKTSSVGIINAIRNSASAEYKAGVPLATETTESIRQIGSLILGYQPRANEFVESLVNRIAFVLLTGRNYVNKYRLFKKGMLEFGETIEEIFVEIANVNGFDFNDETNENPFKRQYPDIKTAFHSTNLRNIYDVTVSEEMLRSAFLSWNGVQDLISKIIDSLYNALEYDEELVVKYLLAVMLLDGKVNAITIPNVDSDNARSIVSTIKEYSNNYTFMNTAYNIAGVLTHTPKNNQILIEGTKFNSIVDVEVLATSFNMEKADFLGRQLLIDNLANIDTKRLAKILSLDVDRLTFTEQQKTLLGTVEAILLDENFFQIYDKLFELRDAYNGKKLYWNYFLHSHKIASVSPFANCIAFATVTNAITSITATPKNATVAENGTLQITTAVATTGFIDKSVKYTVDDVEKAMVSEAGVVTLTGAVTGDTVVITVTAIADESKTDTVTITVS